MAEVIERDEVGEKLAACGLCTAYDLKSDSTVIRVQDQASLPSPWNLPSRLFQFPVNMAAPIDGRPRRIGLRHPLLASHPMVQQIEAATGLEVEPCSIPNRHGIRNDYGQWHHAVDLISDYKWRELVETRAFTSDEAIAGAVVYGLDYSKHDGTRKGYLTPAEARQIMAAIDAPEPEDGAALIRTYAAPALSSMGESKKGWPIQSQFNADVYARAWGKIVGVERGWFAYDRSGFLQWAEEGRTRYAAGDGPTYTEASGQEAFAF